MQKNNFSNIKKFLLFAPFITFLLGYIGSLAYVHVSKVQVPNVVGKSIHDASLMLAKNNIALKVLSEKEDSSLQEGTIISQIPSVGQDIKLSRPLLVVLTKKPKPFLMPDLSSKKSYEIVDLGNDLQRKIKIVNLVRAHADGKCFAQTPHFGNELIDDKIIAYLAVKGSQLYVVPSFINMPLVVVKEALKKQHVSYEIADENQEMTNEQERYVTDQMPIPGTIIPLEKVHMRFSSGNQQD